MSIGELLNTIWHKLMGQRFDRYQSASSPGERVDYTKFCTTALGESRIWAWQNVAQMADLIDGHVTQPNGTVKIVNLETATCSCGNYQENGIPYRHALTCIMSLRLVYYPILTTLNISANTQCSSRSKIICHIFYRLPPGKKPTRPILYQCIYQTWNLYRHNPLRPQFRKLFPLQIMLNLHLLAHPEDVRARKRLRASAIRERQLSGNLIGPAFLLEITGNHCAHRFFLLCTFPILSLVMLLVDLSLL